MDENHYLKTKQIQDGSYDFGEEKIELSFHISKEGGLKMNDLKKVIEKIAEVFKNNDISYTPK